MEKRSTAQILHTSLCYRGSVIYSFSRVERTRPISIDSRWRRGTNGGRMTSILLLSLFFYFSIVAFGCVSDVYADWREPLSLVSFIEAKDSLYTQGSCGVKSLPAQWHHKSVGCKP